MNKLWENLFYRKFAKFINSIEIPRYAFSHHYQLIKLMNFSKSFCWRNSKKEEPPPPARDFFTKFIFIVYSDEIFAKIFFILLKKLCAELSSRRFNIPEINEGQRTVWLATQTHISLKLIEENDFLKISCHLAFDPSMLSHTSNQFYSHTLQYWFLI